jgi:hypothetical protein
MSQLIRETVAYVRDRSRDAQRRQELVRSECGPVDGDCTRRVADLIAGLCDVDGEQLSNRAEPVMVEARERV